MIQRVPFGNLSDGTEVTLFRLIGKDDSHADILDYGATVQAVWVPDRNGELVDVVLGYNDPRGYEKGEIYLGATVGRHANRIRDGIFTLNNTVYTLERNSGPNHSHGGFHGYHQRMFTPEIREDTLLMHLVSPEGDQGYPGTLTLTVSFRFDEENCLHISYRAETDRDTVVNLTNHSYFDLSGGVDPMGQLLTLNADYYTENDENTLPTGIIAPVQDTPFDFRQPKALGQDIALPSRQLQLCRGYDHNFVLKEKGDFARLTSPVTGITMIAATDMPGVQLYTGNFIDEPGGKRSYGFRDGVALESQFFPNAMAMPHFEKPILRAGDIWAHETTYRFM